MVASKINIGTGIGTISQETNKSILTKEQASKLIGKEYPVIGIVPNRYTENEITKLPETVTYKSGGNTYTYRLAQDYTVVMGVPISYGIMVNVNGKSVLSNVYSYQLFETDLPKMDIGVIFIGPMNKGTASVTVKYGDEAVSVYRGGSNFTIKPKEIKIDNATGLVKDTHGISLDVNPNAVSKFGGAYKIDSLPEGLKIIQRGTRTEHFEIVPTKPMTVDRFQELLNKIKTSPVK
ncbi:hypothetical protein CLHUN_42800 [Ruminiclostridium hungatei]|uniref:Uncharacterized protein n=1 Tax=Ruminiclostridium hungatei TaxID=48256 RepID=A0A1V4SDC7_RUMHU|nr:hypothetical protein CLHUN_42800 [Ruminiclostridium hungatei]